MSLRSQLIGVYNAKRIRDAAHVDKAPRPRATAAQRHRTAVKAGLHGGTARMALAAIKKWFGRAE